MSDDIPVVTAGDVDELDDPFLLDVREPDEFDAGHAPGAVLRPLGTVPDAVEELPAGRTVLVICRSGARSARATQFLRAQGVDAVNLEGGMQAWAAFGLDVVRDDGSFGAVIELDPEPAGPLAGIRVLDLSRVLSGPIAGRNLHDLGAEVIKLEPPEGDLTRFAQPKVGSISLYYAQQNTGKRNISIDLRSSEGAAIVHVLAEHVDVIIENYRPGVMDRLGLGWDTLHAANPRLVLASISGYGQTGPWANRRAYAVVIHAEMGLIESGARWRADAAGTPEDAVPVQDGMSHADVYAGLHLTTAVIAALYQRDRTGTGQWVEVDMAEALLHANDFVHWDLSPVDPGDYRPSLSPPYTPIVRTGAGASVVMGGDPAGAGVWEQYCAAMDRPDLRDDPRFSRAERRAHRAEQLAIIEDWAGGFADLDALEHALAEAGIAMGVIRAAGAAATSEWAEARGATVPVDDRRGGTIRIPEAPWRFSGAPTGAGGVPAYRGEHNREVLRELLGTDDATLDDWEARGVLSARVPDSD